MLSSITRRAVAASAASPRFCLNGAASGRAAGRRTQNARRDDTIVWMLYDTGGRASILCGLRRHDLDMTAKKIGWAMAGLPVEFRRDEATFSAGMADLPGYALGLGRAGVSSVTTWVKPSSS